MNTVTNPVNITKLVPLAPAREAANQVPFDFADTVFEAWYDRHLSSSSGVVVERAAVLATAAPVSPRADAWLAVFNASVRDTMTRNHVTGTDWVVCTIDIMEAVDALAGRFNDDDSSTLR